MACHTLLRPLKQSPAILARVAMHMGFKTLAICVLLCGLSAAKKRGEAPNEARYSLLISTFGAGVRAVPDASKLMSPHVCMPCRQLQEVNSTVSARSLAAELINLTKHGAEYAAQGITHVQTVGIAQAGSILCSHASTWGHVSDSSVSGAVRKGIDLVAVVHVYTAGHVL